MNQQLVMEIDIGTKLLFIRPQKEYWQKQRGCTGLLPQNKGMQNRMQICGGLK